MGEMTPPTTLNPPLLKRLCFILLPGVCALALGARADTATNQPVEWIDSDTGHRVVQLSREPGSESLYFNLNPFTPDGRRMVITTPNGISMVNLQTHAIEKIVEGRAHVIMVGRKTEWIYLFRPELPADKSDGNIDTSNLIQAGVFHSEKLANRGRHDYALEPNAMFSPDMKRLIFRSNLSGSNQVYAVEVKTANPR
jgi:hypothetical protein